MAEKTLFEKLKQLNEDDTKNGTRNCSIANTLVRADLVKQGPHVTMGVDAQMLHDLMGGKYVALLMVVNKEEFDKI